MPRPSSWKDIFNGRGYRTSLRGGLRYLFGRRGQRLVRGLRIYYWLRIMAILRTGEPIGRLARKSDVRLWVDGPASFRRLETLIKRSRDHIFIQMFIWKNDETGRHMARLLLDAANRGVRVDITKEAVGDFFEFRGDFLGTRGRKDHPWHAFWNHPRIRIHHATSNDHAKVFVFDGQTLVLTGMNIADEYRERWHDYMVELQGSRFAEQFLTRSAPAHADASIRLVMNTEDRKEMRPVLLNLFRRAQEHVVIEVCYFSDPEVIDTLIHLSHRGVRIIVLLPKRADFHYHANMAAVGRMLAEGKSSHISVLIYPDMFHAKAILVDHDTAFIGSMNLFKASMDDMGEVNVLIHGKTRVLWKLRESLREDILKSRPVSGMPLAWISRWLAMIGL